MLVSGQYVDHLLGEEGGREPNVGGLVLVFLALNMMAATQDVAVDGWSASFITTLVVTVHMCLPGR